MHIIHAPSLVVLAIFLAPYILPPKGNLVYCVHTLTAGNLSFILRTTSNTWTCTCITSDLFFLEIKQKNVLDVMYVSNMICLEYYTQKKILKCFTPCTSLLFHDIFVSPRDY